MTADELVALIVSLPAVEQSSHFGNLDFRVANNIFASHPQPDHFNLKLTPEQQVLLVEAEPDAFRAIPNKWGQRGWTMALAAALDRVTALSAFRMAWMNAAPANLASTADWVHDH